MSHVCQSVFAAKPQQITNFTFVTTTLNDKGGQKVSCVSEINSHLARHGRVKRQRMLLSDPAQPTVRASASSEAWNTGHLSVRAEFLRYDAQEFKTYPTSADGGEHRKYQSTYSFDQPLLSILDPFLQLPVNLSRRDKTVLAHCGFRSIRKSAFSNISFVVLLIDKNQIPGTSKNPEYCVCIRIARDWMLHTPIHTMYILLFMEFTSSRLTGISLFKS